MRSLFIRQSIIMLKGTSWMASVKCSVSEPKVTILVPFTVEKLVEK